MRHSTRTAALVHLCFASVMLAVATPAQLLAQQCDNVITGRCAVALGDQCIASGHNSLAFGLQSLASGRGAIAIGGHAEAIGYQSIAIGGWVKAAHEGALILGDWYKPGDPATTKPTMTTTTNQFMARFLGGFMLYSSPDGRHGVTLAMNGNSWASVSDSTKKERFIPADHESVLLGFRSLRLGSWNYIGDDAARNRHYGAMAQEIHAAFGHDAIGVIGNDTTLASADIDGLLCIAVQALEQRTNDIDRLSAELQALRAEVATLRAAVASKNAGTAARRQCPGRSSASSVRGARIHVP